MLVLLAEQKPAGVKLQQFPLGRAGGLLSPGDNDNDDDDDDDDDDDYNDDYDEYHDDDDDHDEYDVDSCDGLTSRVTSL